jgi:hypothetical protein
MPFPDITYCVVCDGVRPETGGKLIILGFYGLCPNVNIILADPTQPMQLGFVIGLSPADATRQYFGTATLLSPEGAILAQTTPNPIQVSAGTPGVVALGMAAYFATPGRYRIQMRVEDTIVWGDSFSVRQ